MKSEPACLGSLYGETSAATPHNLRGYVTGLTRNGHNCSGPEPGPGLVECVALLCDLRVHSHSSIPNQLADSRLYEIETGLSPFGLSLQVMSASSLEMGLFLLSYRFYPPLFFFLTTCLDRKSSKNLRLNRKWSVFSIKGIKRNENGQDKEREQLTQT